MIVILFDIFKFDCELIIFLLIIVKELLEIIGKIVFKLCCFDFLFFRLFVFYFNDVLFVICKMVNLLLEIGFLLFSLKEVVLLLLLKKLFLDYEIFVNFRLIFNFKMVLKIIEKVVVVCLNCYFEENNFNEFF